ncbi:MAG: helix-turn-helix transcriptional regulator, partial [Chloroflexi bacterium]|nr:helix-turn-helix transcriptional regulator [Chloroflexota bacterium]
MGKPNKKLQNERELRGWSQQSVATAVGTDFKRVSAWETGANTPSPYYREKLCTLFGKDARELGFLDNEEVADPPSLESTDIFQKSSSTTNIDLSGMHPIQLVVPNGTPPIAQPDHRSNDTPVIVILHRGNGADTILPQETNAAQGDLPTIQTLPGEPLPTDSATWFSEKLVQIIFLVNQQCAELCTDFQKILDWELTMFDDLLPFYDADEFHLSRRNALLVIAALPKGLLGMAQHEQKAERMQAEILPPCAASVTACWHLMKGKEITVVERAVSRYFSLLLTWANQSSKYQRSAAYLAAQSCMLMGLVELHRSQFSKWLSYCQQAVKHAKISKDRTLHVYALVFLGSALKENGQLVAMLQTHQEAARYLEEVMPLVRSKVLAELARSHARNGHVHEALHYICQAREVFPGEVGDIPCFVAADCGIF